MKSRIESARELIRADSFREPQERDDYLAYITTLEALNDPKLQEALIDRMFGPYNYPHEIKILQRERDSYLAFIENLKALDNPKLKAALINRVFDASGKLRLIEILEEERAGYLALIENLEAFNPKLKAAFTDHMFDKDGRLRPLDVLQKEFKESETILGMIERLATAEDPTEEIEMLLGPDYDGVVEEGLISQQRLKMTQYLLHGFSPYENIVHTWMNHYNNHYLKRISDPIKEDHETTQNTITAMMKAVRAIVGIFRNPFTQNTLPSSDLLSAHTFRMQISAQRDKYMGITTIFKSDDRKKIANELFQVLDPEKGTVKNLSRDEYYKTAFSAIFKAQKSIMTDDVAIKHEWLHKTKTYSRLYDVTNELFMKLAAQYLADTEMPDKTWLISELEEQYAHCVSVIANQLSKNEKGMELSNDLQDLHKMPSEAQAALLEQVKAVVGKRFHYVVENMGTLAQMQGNLDPPEHAASPR